MSAHRRRRHHPLPLALLALTALLAVLGVPTASLPALAATGAPGPARAVPGPASAAPSRTPSPATTRTPSPDTDERDDEDAAEGAVRVRLLQVSPQVVRPEDELVVRATVRNGGDEVLEVPQATLRVNRFLLSTRSSLDEWVGRGPDATAGSPVASVPLLGPLAPGESAEVELRVPAGDLGLSPETPAWGARGLSVEVTDAGRREALLRTFVLWVPTEEPVTPTRVSVLVPLTGGPVDPLATDDAAVAAAEPPSPGTADPGAADPGTADPGTAEPDASAPTEGPAAEGDGAQGTEADAAPQAPADGGPTPDLTAVGAPADDVLDRLQAVLTATAGQPDVSWAVDPALLAAARAAPADTAARRWVEELTQAAVGRDVLALPARDPDLAALAHGGGSELAAGAVARAMAAVDPALGWPVRADLAWPADGAPDLATAALAVRTGARTLVVRGRALSPERLTYTPTGRATVTTPAGTLDALVSDPVLTDQLEEPSAASPAAAAQRILAETAVVTRERPGEQRHLLLAVDREWEPDVPLTTAQLAALASAPWVELTPLSTLVGAPDPEVDRTTLPERRVAEEELRPGQIAGLLRARAELAQFATIVPDPTALLAGADDAVLLPTAVAWRADPVRRAVVVDGVVDDLTARRSGVSVVPGSSLNLISETGRFPLGLRNDLPQPATVQVAVQPASSLLVIDHTETVTIPARTETQVRIPFHAVGSGDVAVAVSLLTPDGTALGPPQQFTVRVRADWENVGTAVVAGLLGIALVVGIVRTIRRGQTARRGAGSTPVSEIARLPEDPS